MNGPAPLTIDTALKGSKPCGARVWVELLGRARAIRRQVLSPSYRPILNDLERDAVCRELDSLQDALLDRALGEPARVAPAPGPGLDPAGLRPELASLLTRCVPGATFKPNRNGGVSRYLPATARADGMLVAARLVASSESEGGEPPALVTFEPLDPKAVTVKPKGAPTQAAAFAAKQTAAPAGPAPLAGEPTASSARPEPGEAPGPGALSEAAVAGASALSEDAPPLPPVDAFPEEGVPAEPEPRPVAAAAGSELPPFLRQTNLLIGLVLGALLLLGGSIKLAMEIWALDNPIFKFGTFVAGSLVVLGLGEAFTRWLKLKLAGRVVLSVFVLMVPLDLFAADQLDVPLLAGGALAGVLLVGSWHASGSLVGQGRHVLAACFGALALLQLGVGPLDGGAEGMGRMPIIALLAIGSAAATGGMFLYSLRRDGRPRGLHEPIVAGTLLALPFLLLTARVALVSRPGLGALLGPGLLVLAATPLEVGRLLRAEGHDGLGPLISTILGGFLAVVALLVSLFDPQAALCCSGLGVVLLARAFRGEPERDLLLGGLAVSGVLTYAAAIGLAFGRGDGLVRYAPQSGPNAAILYLPLVAAFFLLGVVFLRRGERERGEVFRRIGQLGAVLLLVAAVRGGGPLAPAILGAGLLILAGIDGRSSHAAVGFVCLGVALVAPSSGLTGRAVERAHWIAALGFAVASLPVGLLLGLRAEKPPRALRAIHDGGQLVGPLLALGALCFVLLGVIWTPSPLGQLAFAASLLATLTLAAVAFRQGAPALLFLVPPALGPAAAALASGLSDPISRAVGPGAGRAALAVEVCASVFAVVAALWGKRFAGVPSYSQPERLRGYSQLASGSVALAVAGLGLCGQLRGDALALAFLLFAITQIAGSLGRGSSPFLTHVGAVFFCLAVFVLAQTHMPRTPPHWARLGGALALGCSLLVPVAGLLARGTLVGRGVAGSLLSAVRWISLVAMGLAATTVLRPGLGPQALALVFVALASADWVGARLYARELEAAGGARTARGTTLVHAAMLALLGAVSSAVAVRSGKAFDPYALLIGLTAATVVGGVLGEARAGLGRFARASWRVALVFGIAGASGGLLAPTSLGAFVAPLVFSALALRCEPRVPQALRAKLSFLGGLALAIAAMRGVLVAFEVEFHLGSLETSLALLVAAAVPLILGFVLADEGRQGLVHVSRLAASVLVVSACVTGPDGAWFAAGAGLIFLTAFLVTGNAFDVWAGLIADKIAIALLVLLVAPGHNASWESVAHIMGGVHAALTGLLALGAGRHTVVIDAPTGPTWRALPVEARLLQLRNRLRLFVLVIGAAECASLIGLTGIGWLRPSAQAPLIAGTLGAALLATGAGVLAARRGDRAVLALAYVAGLVAALRIPALIHERWLTDLPALLALYALYLGAVARRPSARSVAAPLGLCGQVTAVASLALAIPAELFGPHGGVGLWLSGSVLLTLAILDRKAWCAHLGLLGLSMAAYTSAFRLLEVSPQHPERAIAGAAVALLVCFLLRSVAVHAKPESPIQPRVYFTWTVLNSFMAFAAFGLFAALFWPQRGAESASWEAVASAGLLLAGATALYVDLTRLLRKEVFVYLAEASIASFFLFLWIARPELFGSGFFRRYWPLVLIGSAYGITFAGILMERAEHELFARPLRRSGLVLPLGPILGAWLVESQVAGGALALSAVLYGTVASQRESRPLWVVAAVLGNGAMWSFLAAGEFEVLGRPELYLAPLALTFVVTGRAIQDRRPFEAKLLREGGALMVYLSLTFALFIDGEARVYESVVLALLSIGGVLLGMKTGIRQFVILGAGFLLLTVTTNVYWLKEDAAWIWWLYLVVMGIGLIVFFSMLEKIRNSFGGGDDGPGDGASPEDVEAP